MCVRPDDEGTECTFLPGLSLAMALGVADGRPVSYGCPGCKLTVESSVLIACHVCEGYLALVATVEVRVTLAW